jgi:hypothetical protein
MTAKRKSRSPMQVKVEKLEARLVLAKQEIERLEDARQIDGAELMLMRADCDSLRYRTDKAERDLKMRDHAFGIREAERDAARSECTDHLLTIARLRAIVLTLDPARGQAALDANGIVPIELNRGGLWGGVTVEVTGAGGLAGGAGGWRIWDGKPRFEEWG